MLLKLKESTFVRNTITLMSGTILAQIFNLLSYPVLTHLYEPSEFGLLGLFSAILVIVVVLVNGGYETVIMLPHNNEDAKQIFVLCFYLASISSAFVFFIVVIVNCCFSHLLPVIELKNWLYFLPLSVFLEGAYIAMSTYLNRQKKYSVLTKSKIGQALTNSLVSVFFGYFLNDFLGGLIVGLISGQFIAFIISSTNVINKNMFKDVSIIELKKHAKMYSDFPKYSIGASYLNSISRQLPFFLLPYYFVDRNVLGYFTVAHKILTAPLTFIGTTISQIYFEKIARANLDGGKTVKQLSLQLSKYIGFLTFIPAFVIIFLGEELFAFVFGKHYLMAGDYARWIMPWIALTYVITPLTSIINVQRRLKFDLLYNTFLLVGRAIVLVIGGIYFSAYETIASFCMISFAFNLFLLVALITFSGRETKV